MQNLINIHKYKDFNYKIINVIIHANNVKDLNQINVYYALMIMCKLLMVIVIKHIIIM